MNQPVDWNVIESLVLAASGEVRGRIYTPENPHAT